LICNPDFKAFISILDTLAQTIISMMAYTYNPRVDHEFDLNPFNKVPKYYS
jgi:hypothetical protein